MSTKWIKILSIAGVVIVLLTVAKKMGWLGNSNELEVVVEQIQKRNIVESVAASGKVQPEVELKITADVSGEIVALFVKEGDIVKKGDLLCRINPEIYNSNLQRSDAAVNGARANLTSAKTRLVQANSQFQKTEAIYLRNKKLFDDKTISLQEFENVKSAWEVAKAEVEASNSSISSAAFNVQSAEAVLKEAKENLNKTNIYAPVDGTVSKLSKEKGERVVGTNMMEGTEIMRLANLNEMEVSVDVSESDIVRVTRGDTAMIEIDAYNDKQFLGVVTEVANSASNSGLMSTDQITNFVVKVRILRDSYKDLLLNQPIDFCPFRPGMSATVEIHTNKVYQILTVPIQAVTLRDTSIKDNAKSKRKSIDTKVSDNEIKMVECVYLLKDGKAIQKVITTGIQDNMYIQVLSGIDADATIISGPYQVISKSLSDQVAVKVVKKEDLFKNSSEK